MWSMRAESSPSAPAKSAAPKSDAVRARERGLSLVARANRWMIGLAVLLAAALSGLTAHAFHAKPARAATSGSSSAGSGSAANASRNPGGSASPAPLQAPSRAPSVPAPAAAPAPAPVVSGGS